MDLKFADVPDGLAAIQDPVGFTADGSVENFQRPARQSFYINAAASFPCRSPAERLLFTGIELRQAAQVQVGVRGLACLLHVLATS